jgi:SulP family sulfate permease
LIGVGLGLLAAIILFTVTYSRINVVHHALSGAERTSNVERPLYHRRTLNQMGKQTSILELRGFIFFGTANSLLERIKARLADPKQPPVHQLLLDFRLVTGLDSSAVFSFRRLHQLAEAHGITLILTHLSPSVRRQLEQGGLLENSAGIKFFPDLDHGLEWCEDEMLRIEQVTKVSVPIVLPAQLKASGFEDDLIPRLMPYLELRIVSDGEYLTRQGDDAHDLYFIEIGQATIYLESDDGQQMRLGTLGMGTLVGELGFYLGSKRTASVVTSGTCRIYRLSTEALDQINEQDPDLAAAFHKYMAHLLAERLVNTDRLVEAMSE